MIQNVKPAIENEQTRGVTDPAVKVMALRVEFHTGDVRFAGTDANVFLRIGERTFQMPVDYGKDPFERGAKDAFNFTMDPPMTLAELRAATIDVYHDSEGQNPGWLIKAVRIWVLLSTAPDQGLLYKEWQDVGWLAIDEKPATIKVTLQEPPK